MFSPRPKAMRTVLALAASAVLGGAALPAASQAATDPVGCSTNVTFDPTIKTWAQFFADGHNPKAVRELGAGAATAGGGASPYGVTNLDDGVPRGRNLNEVLLEYADYLTAATATSSRVRIAKKPVGTSALGRPIAFYVVSTPLNINGLDGPNGDAEYWRGVREGRISTEDALEAAVERPALGWITATPHGDESAAGESIARLLYELAARTDCQNLRRISSMDFFLQLVRNPDGRDAVVRQTAWAFDPNRDFGTRNQVENGQYIPLLDKYPGLFFVDAHQQGGYAYFFPPNEDPVHHEISTFSLDTIQKKIGPALQKTFNDQSAAYTNYSQYDLFAPEFGDTVPSLIMGAAGMTYEKGNAEAYSRQVYDHYLALDATINTIADDKVATTRDWVRQWSADPVANPAATTYGTEYGAIEQGRRCELQPNKLVSPLHDSLDPVPADKRVCGYFYRPDRHLGDVASLMKNLQEVGVRVYRLNSPAALTGVKDYGKPAGAATLPAGTLWIPMAQGQKHWIEAILGENPHIPYPYYYDVVSWSYGMQRGLAGDGYLVDSTSLPTDLTEVNGTDFGGAAPAAAPVYAFDTDSMQALALTAELLSRNVKVSRATTAFDAGGRHFFTGAALVDGASLAASGANLGALAKDRQTPVLGLPNYPVSRKEMTKPKIGLYTGSATIPSNPLYVSGPQVNNSAAPGHCSVGGNTAFCNALFTLRVKDRMPASTVVPITQTDINGGVLASGGFTALINVTGVISGATADAVKTWVNLGGRFVGTGVTGASSARNAGLSNAYPTLYAAPVTNQNPTGTQTTPLTMRTPGSTYDATFDTTDPVAWGFDLGGWIYRSATADPMFEPASLQTPYTSPTVGGVASATFANPASSAAVSYATDLNSDASLKGQKYGLSVNATGPGLLDGRAAVVSSSPGAGHATVFGFDPFFRAWKEQDERLVLNAALYPTTVTEQAAPATAARGEEAAPLTPPTAKTTVEAAKPVAAAKLPTPKQTTRKPGATVDDDVELVTTKKFAAKLRKAYKAAKIPKAIRRKASFQVRKATVTLVLRNVRGDDFHGRQEWVSSLMGQIKKQRVKLTRAQL